MIVINPRRASAARVIQYLVWSVCLSRHISLMDRLFVLKTLSRTQQATKNCGDSVADLEIWKGGFKVVGVAQKAAEGSRRRRITRAAEQPKYRLKM